MTYKDNAVKDLKICYIGGGSRGWAWAFMADLANDNQICGEVALYDIDHKAAMHNAQIGNSISALDGASAKWRYEAKESLSEALTGADFVVISILPGTFDEMQSDVHLPERHGIYQPVGDTAGPGGIIRALRTIPMFVEIAEAIKAHAPNAWVVNYTNPMSICIKTLYHVFPNIKAFGCCHEVFGTQKMLASILKRELDIVAKRDEIKVNVFGINHFTWLDYASYKGIDLMPIYKAFVERNFDEGINEKDENWLNSSFASQNRIKFDLFRRYGYIAAAGDRHLAEFVNSDLYLKDRETVNHWKFGLTTVEWRKKDLAARVEKSRRLISGELAPSLEPSGEEGVLLIKALCGLGVMISNVNIPNHALQVANVDKHAIVETNALFERDAIRPISAGHMPEAVLELTRPHLENHELTLRAALTCDKSLVVQAFENDPLLGGKLNKGEVAQLVDDMISNTKGYLPAGW